MAFFDLIIRATQSRQGAQEFAQAGQKVQQSARDAATQVDRLDREMDQLGPASRRAGQEIGQLARQATASRSVFGGLATSLRGYIGVFAAFRVASGAARTIAEFERGTVQAAKAADIATRDMGRFRAELTRIATIRGVEQSSAQLAEIAAVAGTLGVRGADNLTRFTETTAKLTSSLRGVGSEDVATGMGRILQITGEGADGVERFGNVFARLEDSVAGGAAEILNTSKEVALATARFNVSSTDVLGLGAAFTDIGIQSELARSTLTRTLGTISAALARGGEDAEKFGKITGLSVSRLRESLSQDAAGTFIKFLDGLGRMTDAGEDAGIVLEDLKLAGLRLTPVLSTGAERSYVFADAMRTARKEAEELSKLQQDQALTAGTLTAAYANLKAELSAVATDQQGVGAFLASITTNAAGAVSALRGVTPPDQIADADVTKYAIELAKELNAEQQKQLDHIRELYSAERKRRDELNKPLKDAIESGREGLRVEEEEAAKEATKRRAEAIGELTRQQDAQRESTERATASIADQRRAIELLQAELDGADSAGIAQLAAEQEIDAQVASMIQLGVSASEYVAYQEEAYANAQRIAAITREQEANEAAVTAEKRAQADAAREREAAERKLTQELERQAQAQQRAQAGVAASLGDARFEGSIAGLSQEDQQRARELQRFTEQANDAFGAGSSGATASVEEFKSALDFRDQQREIRDLSQALAGDLTGSVRGLSDAFADGKVTGQEFRGILAGVLGDLTETLTTKLLIDPLTDQLANGISGLLSPAAAGGDATAAGTGAAGVPGAASGAVPPDATKNALGLSGLLGGAGGAAAGLPSSVGSMTVNASSVVVNGGGEGGSGGSGGIGGTGIGVGEIGSLLGSVSTGNGGILPSATSIGAGLPAGSTSFLNAPSGGGGAAGFDAAMFSSIAAPAEGTSLGLSAGGGQAIPQVAGAEQPGVGAQLGNAVGGTVGNVAGQAIGNAILPGLGVVLGPLLGSLLGGVFAKGGVFGAGSGQVRRYALGGVVASPSFFETPDGLASVGEVNEEGILPLGRNARGELGVKQSGGGGGGSSTVVFNISTPNADSFRRAQGQITRRQEREDRRRRAR